VAAAEGTAEHSGAGLSLATPAGPVRLGSRAFCAGGEPGPDAERADPASPAGPELWLARPGHALVRFGFAERPRADAAAVVARLRDRGLAVRLLSGDRAPAVARLAASVGIADWQAGCSPIEKTARIEAWAGEGRRVLMVGDGLNDSPGAPGDAAEPGAGRGLQRSDGAAGGGGAGHAVAGGGGDVGVVPAGDGKQPAAVPGAAVIILLFLLAVSLVLGGLGLVLFLWCLRSGQYEDLDGAAERVLFEDE
jgi:cbb3-type cytochrome oxidase maturation protein